MKTDVTRVINAEDVPERKRPPPKEKWRPVFESIPEGKAGVIENVEVKDASTINHSLKIQQKHGRFLNFKVARRTMDNGQINVYIINSPRLKQ